MAHKVWIIIVSCFCLQSLYGVEMRGSRVTGHIAEQGTGQPLEFADVALYRAADSVACIDRLADSRAFRMTYVGLPLVAGGLLIKGEDDHFRHLRNDYLPHFNRHADDYLQYLPAAVMLGMKLGGVEGRSSWGRMLTSDAFSALLMGSVVYSLKQTTHVMRPDGSNDHSFPSGHTATAFMTATMLTKEYGHKSPWIGIGAYSVATATGLMRMANNKHPKLQFHDITVPQRNGFSFGSGLSLIFQATGHYGMKLFLDYNLMPSHSRGNKEWMNTLTCGASFAVSF